MLTLTNFSAKALDHLQTVLLKGVWQLRQDAKADFGHEGHHLSGPDSGVGQTTPPSYLDSRNGRMILAIL
jgi:hypothetical protein